MKKLMIAMLLCVVSGPALAQMSSNDLAAAQAKIKNLEQAAAIADAADTEVARISVGVSLNKGKREGGDRTRGTVTILPSDAEFAAVLAAAKAVAARRATVESTALKDMGVSVTPKGTAPVSKAKVSKDAAPVSR